MRYKLIGCDVLYREFCAAVAQWLGRRYRLPRPIDPATEVLVPALVHRLD
jgi:hypothetical protein